MRIRQATVSDSSGIARVHVESWKATYKGQVSDEYLNSLSIADRTKRWEEWFAWDGLTVVVAEDHAQIKGFASFGRCQDDEEDATTGEVFAIYLLADEQRAGIGQSIWKVALQRLKERGFTAVTVWVLETNSPARRFYEKMGGVLDGGTKTGLIGTQKLLEVRYRFNVMR
jgi:GNAT superfamily N-acetyltransferase